MSDLIAFSSALSCYNKGGEVLLGCLELSCFELSWANMSSIFLPGIERADGLQLLPACYSGSDGFYGESYSWQSEQTSLPGH